MKKNTLILLQRNGKHFTFKSRNILVATTITIKLHKSIYAQSSNIMCGEYIIVI